MKEKLIKRAVIPAWGVLGCAIIFILLAFIILAIFLYFGFGQWIGR